MAIISAELARVQEQVSQMLYSFSFIVSNAFINSTSIYYFRISHGVLKPLIRPCNFLMILALFRVLDATPLCIIDAPLVY